MDNKRIQYVDFYKFIGITLMIMGHVGFGNEFDKYIHAFHMPLFFVASGYCFVNGRRFIDFLKRKTRGILVPYFTFSTITYFVLRDINEISFKSMKHVIWVNNLDTPIAGVWFLTALFWANVLYFFICRFENKDVRWLLALLCFLMGSSIETTIGITMPWSISQGLIGVLFIHMGKCLYDQRDQFSSLNGAGLTIGFVLISASIFLNSHVNLRTLEHGNIALCVMNATVMSAILLVLSERTKVFGNNKVYQIMCRIGRYSICYLCLNQMLIRYSTALCDSVFKLPRGGVRQA